MEARITAEQLFQMDLIAIKDKKKPTNSQKFDRVTQAMLGQQLRAMYDEVVNQGVPDRFSVLLDRLADHENKDEH